MALSTRFVPHAAYITGASAFVNQCKDIGADAGVSLFEESSGSEVDTAFVAAKELAHTFAISTTDLTILTTAGFAGYAVVNTAAGFIIYGRELPLGGLPTAIGTANHFKGVATDGLIVPTSIRCAHNQAAQLGLTFHAVLGSGGSSSAVPVVWSNDVTIASGAGGTSNLYTTGPVKWTVSGGSAQLLQGIMDLGADFGISVLKEGSDGNVYPTHVSIPKRSPKFSFTTADAQQIAAIGDGISVSAFAMYFQNIAANGQRVAPATGSHVSISSSAGMITPARLGLTHQRSGSQAFVFTPSTLAGADTIISISDTAAIPTS